MSNLKLQITTLVVLILLIYGISCCIYQVESYSTPSDFTKSSLYGIWVNRRYEGDEQLVIKEDGTFTQTYIASDQNYTREINSVWEIETLEDGQIYLHLYEGRYYVLGPDYGIGDTMYNPITATGVNVSTRLTLLIQLNQDGEIVLNHLVVGKDDGYIILTAGGAMGYRLIAD